MIAEQIITLELSQRLSEFNSLGGVLDFKIFQITGAGSALEAHTAAARSTLDLLKQDNDNVLRQIEKEN